LYITTMSAKILNKNDRKLLTLMSDLSRGLRCCQQEAVLCENITFSQFFILDVVAEQGELKLADLHGILSVDKSTTTRLVSPLVKEGLVVRVKSNHDSRAVNLRLTPRGEEVHQEVWECISGFMDRVEMNVPEEKREKVYEAVRIFLNAMRNACAVGDCCVE
jgi:DNA-binding MarR family transcriptional regulator